MKPISLAAFLPAMLVLGITLLWFPNLCTICSNLMPIGTPPYLIDFLVFLPFLTLSIILIALVIKLSKRGRPEE